MTLNDLGRCAFRIIAIENCIALEYSHAVSDGYGGSVFLKSLIAEYLNIRYALPISRFSGVLCVNESPTCDEIKDDYPRIAGSSYKVKDLSSAYSLRGTPDNALHITELTLKADELLRCAGGYGVTLTAFLSGVLVAAISDLRRYENREKEEIRLSIPVDLRRRFRSSTLRNFTLPTTVYAKEAGVSMDMPALCLSLGKQLKENINKETLSAMATPYVKMAKSRFVSGIPLFLKKWLVQTFFSLSKGGNCMTFSNLGVWRLPDEMKPYVRQCGIVLSPKSATPYSCGVISVGNTLTLSLTRNIKEPLLEQRVAKILNHFIYPLKTQWELIA
jgi:NRPS condensation-like uncharacterized protein